MIERLGTIAALLFFTACVSVNKSILDRTRMAAPVPRDVVQVYLPGDSVPPHQRIAILNARGDVEMTNEGQMLDRLREEAGKLGANAIILGDVNDPGTGARVAQALLGTSASRTGQAVAVYVPSLASNGS